MPVGRGRGVPNQLMLSNNHAKKIDHTQIAQPSDAVHHFQSFGGHLTLFSGFGEDPLKHSAGMVAQREEEFKRRYPDFGQFFSTVVNSDYSLFKEGLLYFIELSQRLSSIR